MSVKKLRIWRMLKKMREVEEGERYENTMITDTLMGLVGRHGRDFLGEQEGVWRRECAETNEVNEK